jgi:hypothetical protein
MMRSTEPCKAAVSAGSLIRRPSNVTPQKSAASTKKPAAKSTRTKPTTSAHRPSKPATTRNDWAHAFLANLNVAPAGENLFAILTWIRAEFGGAHPIPAHWNPLATTHKAAGTTDYNKVGVKNYPSFAEGVQACADTLRADEPGYAAIRSHLDGQARAEDTISAIHNSAWGSKPTDAMLNYVRSHDQSELLLAVGDADATHVPGPPAPTCPFPGVNLANRTEGHGTATWQTQMHRRGWTISIDDIYGPKSEAVCKAFQHEKGLAVDGIVGPITWAATWTAPIT